MAIAGSIFKGIKGAFQSGAGSAASSFGKGAQGALGVAGTGFGLYAAHQTYASEYGAGGAFAMGAAEAGIFLAPAIVTIPAYAGYSAASALYDYGKSTYRDNRKLNFGKPIDDRFGTAATMRQRSASTLQRGRATLGSEARLMHY